MNERIKELAEQANAWYPMGYPSGEGGDAAWENLVIFEKEDLEKFAELIVRQMLGITDAHTEVFQTDRDRALIEHIKKSVKQHFGVEE